MKCKLCKVSFKAKFFNQKHCMESEACIKAEVEMKKAAKWKKEKKEIKESLRSKKDYIKILQILFNKFIRLRDANLPCISCGRKNVEEFHAGHYIASTYQVHRFNEFNVHKQCSFCNTHLRGNLIEYRANLIAKIGIEKVEQLEQTKHNKFDLTISDLKQLITEYKLKLKTYGNDNKQSD